MPIYKYQNNRVMLDLAVNLCKNVIDFIISEKKLNRENKIIVSQTLLFIGQVLEDTAISLKNNIYPNLNCATMESLSERLLNELSEHMSIDDVNHLHTVLKEASQVEKQFALRNEPETIPTIEKAAGEFKALSLLANL